MSRTHQNHSELIGSLTENLEPTRPIRLAHGAMLAVASAVATAIIVELAGGIRAGFLYSMDVPLYLVANGLFAVLAVAASATVIKMVSPRVGNRHNGASGAIAMLIVLPVAAFVTLVIEGSHGTVVNDHYGVSCTIKALLASTLVAGALTLWLRRGAPVSLSIAGFYIGTAAGAAGSLLYGLSCPVTSVAHLGIWHVMPIVIAAVVGRFAVPYFIRW